MQNLYENAKIDYNIIQDVKNWLNSQKTYTLHKLSRKRFKRNQIVFRYLASRGSLIWQI